MKKLYFTRHGETFWNVENKICGATDIGLTPKGHSQAYEAGEKIKNEIKDIDLILYSPLSRAADTARHIAEATGLPCECEPLLREQAFGKWEGTARNGKEFFKDKMQFVTDYDGGESMLKLAHRIYTLLDRLKEDDKTYLLVAHNGIARVINSYFFDMTNEEYSKFGIKNCEILTYTFGNENK